MEKYDSTGRFFGSFSPAITGGTRLYTETTQVKLCPERGTDAADNHPVREQANKPRIMSAIEPSTRNQLTHLEELPEFELEYLFDDDESPTEVTVFADDPETLSTRWITIDRSFAVPLEEVR